MIKFSNPLIFKIRDKSAIIKKFLLTVFTLIVFFNVSVYAQDNFRNGYIITKKNDTIQGQLEYRSNMLNYRSCIFKKNNKTEEFLPAQIKGYGFINDKFYTSGIVNGSFSEVLVKGTINLYKCKNLFYVSKNNGKVLKLESKYEKFTVDGLEGMKKDNRWRGIISYLISDCISNPLDRVRRLDYDEHELVNLIVSYNTCRKTKLIVYKKDKPWSRFQYGGVLGISLTEISSEVQSGTTLYSYINSSYRSASPMVGVVFLFTSPRVSDRIGIQPEIHISKTSYSGYKAIKDNNTAYYYDTYINLTTLSVPVSLNYIIQRKKNSFYLQAGFDFQTHLQSKTDLKSEYVMNQVVYTYPEREAFLMDKNNISVFGGVGFSKSFSKFSLNARIRYYAPTKMTSQLEYNLTKDEHIEFSIVILKK